MMPLPYCGIRSRSFAAIVTSPIARRSRSESAASISKAVALRSMLCRKVLQASSAIDAGMRNVRAA